MTETVDYSLILADLERRRDEINQAIATIQALAGVAPTSSGDGAGGSTLTKPMGAAAIGLRKHQFFGMKAPDAIKSYLATVKQTRTATQIANDLVEYGFTTASANRGNTIRTALGRLEEDGEVVKVKKEWGLPNWFPGLRKKGGAKKTDEGGNGQGDKKTETKRPLKKGGWREFLQQQLKVGKTMKEASAMWKAQQTERGKTE